MEQGFKACPYCAEPIREAATICRYCNRPLNLPGTARAKDTRVTLGGSKATPAWRWILYSIFGVAALALLFYNLWRRPATNQGSQELTKQIAKMQVPGVPLNRQSLQRKLSSGEIYAASGPSVVLITNYDSHGHKRAMGSGFLVSSGGDVVTNYHVIRGAYRAEAGFESGIDLQVTGVIGYNREHDVAVIQLNGSPGVSPLPLSSTASVKTGEKLVAIGSPLGLQNSLSEGIVSAMRGEVLQMTTPISPGSSGGPVLNEFGQVVGIADAYMPSGENLNFAVPVDWAKPYIGKSPSQTLQEVAQENTIQTPISTTASVPAGRAEGIQIKVTQEMADPELDFTFTSRGGMDNVVQVRVMQEQGVIWDSGRVSSGQAEVDLPGPGSYELVIDNTPSTLFSRTVTITGELQYVK
jgi:S1-C subfamily serine protease